MRIANNVMAMNTHRAYTANNDKVQTSAEKLSSGYRINRAGDDAAGLAISEKMRSQIRGLNMSTKNSQDAVSLIQTAEGALQEVHSMLQRMNELAVQSATGTNETFDRTQIAKEFEQLKREINDISEQTTFNNMKILDGSLSAKGLQRTEYTSGVYKTFEAQAPTADYNAIANVKNGVASQYFSGTPASFSVDLKDVKINDAAGDTIKLEFGDQTVGTFKTTAANKADAKEIAAGIWSSAPASIDLKVGADTVSFAISKDGDTGFKFTAKSTEKEITKSDLQALRYKVTGTATTAATGLTSGAAVNVIDAGTAQTNATTAKSSFEFNYESAKSGDVLNIGKQSFVFYNSNEDDLTDTQKKDFAASPFMLDLAKVNTASALAEAIGTTTIENGVVTKLTGAQNDGSVTPDKRISATASGKIVEITYAGNGALATPTDNTKTGGIYGAASEQYVAVSGSHINELPKSITAGKAVTLDTAQQTGTITQGAFTINMAKKGVSTVAEKIHKLSFDITGVELAATGGGKITAGDKVFLIKDADGKQVGFITSNGGQAAGTSKTSAEVAGIIKGGTMTLYGSTFDVKNSSGAKLELESKTGTTTKDLPTGVDLSKLTIELNPELVNQYKPGSKVNNPGATVTQVGNAGVTTAVTAQQIIKITDADLLKVNDGDTFSVGGKTFTFIKDTDKTKGLQTGTTKINITGSDGNLDVSGLGDAIAGAFTSGTKVVKGTATSSTQLVLEGETPTASDTKDPFTGDKGFRFNPVQTIAAPNLDALKNLATPDKGTTTFEIDTLKLKAGDILTYDRTEAGKTTTYQHQYKAGQTAAEIAASFGIKKEEMDGNTWKIEGKLDQSDILKFKAADDYKAGTYDTMKIQVGALQGEQLGIKINSMNTAGLGLDEQKIYTQADAGKAVTATRDAINKVSDQRALLGAMQNRMGHKIANLKVSVENLQASESRIRDIDIASEMTSFTKNNILAQAATAMLAQANSAPQNVLSLLR